MQINSFKLIDAGSTGIRITAREAIPQGNLTIIDEVTRTRLYPLPEPLKISVQKLKYFFLNLTGHWIEVFNKSFDLQTYKIIDLEPGTEPLKSYLLLQSLMNHTEITGVTLKNAGFCIQGTIETVEGKKMGLSTPFITEEDDVSFFIEATDKINHILDEVGGVLKSSVAIEFDAREVIERRKLKVDNIDEMSKDEMADLVVAKLNDLGFIVLTNEGMDAIEAPKKDRIVKSGSIDSHRMPEAEIEEKSDEKIVAGIVTAKEAKEKEEMAQVPGPDDEQIIIKDKKDIGKGSLASEKKFPRVNDEGKVTRQQINESDVPEGATLEHLEFSENLGMQREGTDQPEQTEDIKTEW